MSKQKTSKTSESRMEIKKRERAQIILESAFKSFETNGYKNTTMAMIAEQADMSVGSLYNYYRTKEELLLNGIVLSLGGFVKEIEEQALSKATCEERWMKLTDTYLESLSFFGKRVWREFFAVVLAEAPECLHDIEQIDMPFIAGIQSIFQDFPQDHSTIIDKDYFKSALIIYQLWLQKVIQFIVFEPITLNQIQSIFIDELKTIGILV